MAVAGAVARGALNVARVVGAKGLVIGEFDKGDLANQCDVVVEASGAIPAFNTVLNPVRLKGRVSILSNIQLREA